MIITKTHVENLLHLLTFGLISGAGDDYNADKRFCVQQAVHKVITGDLEGYSNDHPRSCVKEGLIGFGIRLNDKSGWDSNHSRAKGLKRFAIAEMGTAEMEGFSMKTFDRKLSEKLGLEGNHEEMVIDDYLNEVDGNGDSMNNKLTYIANMAAEVLKEMETPGSRYLYLADEPNKVRRMIEAHRLANRDYAAQDGSTLQD